MRNTPHTIEVWGQVQTGTDVYGNPTYEFTLKATVRGWFGVLDAAELEPWAGQSVTASARVAHGADVELTDEVRVDGHPGVGDDRFEVATIRPNPDLNRTGFHGGWVSWCRAG